MAEHPPLDEALENLRQTVHYEGDDRARIAEAIRRVSEALKAGAATEPKNGRQ